MSTCTVTIPIQTLPPARARKPGNCWLGKGCQLVQTHHCLLLHLNCEVCDLITSLSLSLAVRLVVLCLCVCVCMYVCVCVIRVWLCGVLVVFGSEY